MILNMIDYKNNPFEDIPFPKTPVIDSSKLFQYYSALYHYYNHLLLEYHSIGFFLPHLIYSIVIYKYISFNFNTFLFLELEILDQCILIWLQIWSIFNLFILLFLANLSNSFENK